MGAGTETGSSRHSLTAAGEGMRPVRNDGGRSVLFFSFGDGDV